MNQDQIKDVLERIYGRYNYRRFIGADPLQFLWRYLNCDDIEIVGFIAAALAYGRVQQIEKSLNRVFEIMGERPAAFVAGFSPTDRKKFSDFKHRFTTGDDLADLFEIFQRVTAEHGSLEKLFLKGYKQTDTNIIPALGAFCDNLLSNSPTRRGKQISRGLKYLIVSPENGSVCKRMNLFLRWMIRKDRVDPGIWKSVDKSKLIVPVDVHMTRLTGILGFHQRNSMSLKAAIEITEAFSRIKKDDPVKYDFSLCRIGILENCNGKMNEKCRDCEMFDICLKK